SSWSAYEAIDMCYVGGWHNTALLQDNNADNDMDPGHASAFGFPLQFGCQTKITGLFKTQLADGIMGMENAQSSYWHQMYEKNKIDNKSFSLCFSRPEAAERAGTEAGAMTLGGAEPALHRTPMVYTTTKGTSSADGFFSVHVRAVYLRDGKDGDSALPNSKNYNVINLNRPESSLNAGGVIVDSGTTDTYWNSNIKTALRKTFKELSGMDFGHAKVTMTEEQLHAMPTILFQLDGDVDMNKKVVGDNGGDPNAIAGLAGTDLDPDHPYDVILAVPASHYMEGEKGTYVNRFYDTEGGGSVLGGNTIMGHDVLFDADHGRIGWAESSCDYSAMLQENGYSDVLEGGELVPVPGAKDEEQQEEEKAAADAQAEAKEDPPADSPVASPDDSPVASPNDSPVASSDDSPVAPTADAPVSPPTDAPVPKPTDAPVPPPTDAPVDPPTNPPTDKKKPEKPKKDDNDDDDAVNGDEEPSTNDKKTEPDNKDEDMHEGDSPVNDIQKAIADNCTGLICGGGLAVFLLFSCLFCICCYRCFCKKTKPRIPPAAYEVEMSMNNGSYKDEFNDEEDDDDAEYGVVIQSSYKDN
ncbi:MAG: hypothetical protein SGILL_009513, partial [Bacillariaceae sp.]